MPMTENMTHLSNAHLSLTLSDLGAEMQTLTTADGRELLWHGDPAFWAARAPLLFPIVGRTRDNWVAVGDHQAEMAIHGFLRHGVFSRDSHDGEICQHSLCDSDATRHVYPFAFQVTVTHRLDGPTLHVIAEIENRDTDAMPFGFGFHPGFRWPLPGFEGQPHRVTLDNGAEPLLARLEGGLMTRETLPSPFVQGRIPITPGMFDNDALVIPQGAGDGLCYGVESGGHLAFRFENLPNLALWSKPGASFLCIEPWHGLPGETDGTEQIAERPFSVLLPPGDVARFGWSVTVAL